MNKHLTFVFASLCILSVLLYVPQIRAAESIWQGVWSETLSSFRPTGRATHSAIWDSHNNQMIVFGGHYDSSPGAPVGLKDVWHYNPISKIWSQGQDALMTRGEHVAVWDTENSQMIIYGGESYYGSHSYYRDTWTYNPTTISWSKRADGPTVRAWATGVWDPVHRQMLVFGGYYPPTNDGLDDTWAYVPSSNTWIEKITGPQARWAHMAVWNSRDDTMIVFGGADQSTYYKDTWVYNPQLEQWQQKADMPYALAQASAVWDTIHNVAIVFGGEEFQGDRDSAPNVNKTLIYDPVMDKWTVLGLENQPSARGWLQGVSVWDATNNQMLIFGGSGGGYLSDLWAFKISTVNEPEIIWLQWWLWTNITSAITTILLITTTVHYRKKASTQKQIRTRNSLLEPSKKSKACPNCGASLPVDSKFCGKCGTSLE